MGTEECGIFGILSNIWSKLALISTTFGSNSLIFWDVTFISALSLLASFFSLNIFPISCDALFLSCLSVSASIKSFLLSESKERSFSKSTFIALSFKDFATASVFSLINFRSSISLSFHNPQGSHATDSL